MTQVLEDQIDPNNPKEHEKQFLQDRGLLKGEEVPVTYLTPDGQVVSNDPRHFASLQLRDDSAFQAFVEKEVERRVAEQMMASQLANANAQSEDTGTVGPPSAGTPVPGSEDEEQGRPRKTLDDVELPEGAPGEGWTNPQLRKALKDRGLDHARASNEELLARLAEAQ